MPMIESVPTGDPAPSYPDFKPLRNFKRCLEVHPILSGSYCVFGMIALPDHDLKSNPLCNYPHVFDRQFHGLADDEGCEDALSSVIESAHPFVIALTTYRTNFLRPGMALTG